MNENNPNPTDRAVAGTAQFTPHCDFCNSPIPNKSFFKCFICNTRYCSLECLSRHDAITEKARIMKEENNIDWGGQENE